MDGVHSAVSSAALDSTVLASQWDQENAVLAFEPEDKPQRLRAWEREQRPSTKLNGKNRIIWKRHETRAQRRLSSGAASIAQRSPQKVVKKVCLTKEGATLTPKHKRLGIAASWDRRQSDRLHKPRSIRVVSPLKVRRDSVHDKEDAIAPSLYAPNKGSGDNQGQSGDYHPAMTAAKHANIVSDDRASLEPCTNSHYTFDRSNTTRLGEASPGLHSAVEYSGLTSVEMHTEPEAPDMSEDERNQVALGVLVSAERSADAMAPMPLEKSSEKTLTVPKPQGDAFLSDAISKPEYSGSENIADKQSDSVPTDSDIGSEVVTDVGSDVDNPTEDERNDLRNDAFADDAILQEKIPADTTNDHCPTEVEGQLRSEGSSDDGASDEEGEEDDNNDDDETCMVLRDQVNSIEDERLEIAMGSPGRTGPVETPDFSLESKQEELHSDQELVDQHVTAILADDDMFADLDDAIARENMRNQVNTSTNRVDAANSTHDADDTAEVVEETTTVTVQFNDDDDTEMLRDFLNRSRASRAARIAKRSSLNNKRDSDAVKLALASPQKPVEEDIDQTIDCAPGPITSGNNAGLTSPEKETSGKTIDSDLPDELTGSPAPQTSRRSARNREVKSTPSTITIRRPGGSEPVLLKKSEAQELAIATRANTRRNKGGALSVKLMLMRLKSLDQEVLPEIERETAIKWNEQLVNYFDERNVDRQLNEYPSEEQETHPTVNRPRVRRKRTLGAMNGTPARPKHAEDSLSSIVDSVTASHAPQVEPGATESQINGQEIPQPGEDTTSSANKRKRTIPTPTSRVPRRAGQSRTQSNHHAQIAQHTQIRDSAIVNVSPDASDINDGRSAVHEVVESRPSKASSQTQLAPGRSSTTSRMQSQSGTGTDVSPPSSTDRSAASAGGDKPTTKGGTTTTSAIASAAASVGKRGLNGGIVGARVFGRETRSAVKR